MSDQLIETYGFRSIIDQYQSWPGFTCCLFRGDTKRREFDSLQFIFNGERGTQIRHIDSVDDISLTAAYRGSPVEHTIFYCPSSETLEDKLQLIKDILPSFFARREKNMLSEPIFIIDELTYKEIGGYYIWQSE